VLEAIVTECLLDAAGDVPMRLKRVIPASDNARDLAQVDEAIANLEADPYERHLLSGERGAERYASMMTKLEKRQAELMALPVRPELVEWTRTGESFGKFWEGLSGPERHTWLRSAGVRVYALHSDDDGLPMPDPSGRVVLVVGSGLRVTVHLGDVAELRERAAGQASGLTTNVHRVMRP
jgi:hypothetical protein